MSAKHSLTDEVKKAEQKCNSSLNLFADREKKILNEAHEQIDDLKVEMSREKDMFKNLSDRKKDKEDMYDEKLKVIDEALNKIEEISKVQSQ